MRKYELVCIFDPQAGESKFDDLVEKYEVYLNSHGGELANIDRWGMRQLAYTTPSMRSRRQGYYVLYQFEAEPTIVEPLEDELRIDENVLRHLVILADGEFLRIPQLLPENEIVFGPPQQRDRGRGRDRGDRRRERDAGPPARRSGRAEAGEQKPGEGAAEQASHDGDERADEQPAAGSQDTQNSQE